MIHHSTDHLLSRTPPPPSGFRGRSRPKQRQHSARTQVGRGRAAAREEFRTESRSRRRQVAWLSRRHVRGSPPSPGRLCCHDNDKPRVGARRPGSKCGEAHFRMYVYEYMYVVNSLCVNLYVLYVYIFRISPFLLLV